MELIQEILTYLIVGVAFFIAARQLIRTLNPKKSASHSCGPACNSCVSTDLKKGEKRLI